jgi:2-dehydropantoate 2-reductase
MKIAIMGAGGMGAYYGANLAAAGQDIAFIARGAHLAAIKHKGLLLSGPAGNIVVNPAVATDDPSEIGPVDAVLFCVKLHDIETAAAAIQPMLKPDTMVISVLNGVDGPRRIASVIGPNHVLGGAAYASGVIEKPGVVSYKSSMASLVIGELDGKTSARAEAFRNGCIDAGFTCSVTDNILGVLWNKFILLATNAGLSSLCRRPVAVVYDDPDLVVTARAMMQEIVEIATVLEIAIDPDIIETSIARSKTFPPDMYASMYHDLARGRPLEVAGLSGHVTRLGIELGISTPHHQTVFACLKPFMNGGGA